MPFKVQSSGAAVLSPTSYESGKAERNVLRTFNALKHGEGLTAGKQGRSGGLLFAIEGGIDGVVLDLIFAEYIIKQEKMSLFVVPEGLTNEEYAIGFRKEDIELKNAVQNILEELAADGTCSAISKKWFGKDIIAKDLLN